MSQKPLAGANIVFPECIICLNALQSNLITPIRCGHVFHEECFRNWKNKSSEDICPLCKRDSSNTIKLIYDIKYCQEDNTNQDPQSLHQLLERNKYLKFKNENLEKEVKELQEYNDKCQKIVEGFRQKVEDNNKNMMKYKNEYLNVKTLLDEEKEKNEKNLEKIDLLQKEVKNLKDFKNKFEMKSKIDEETDKIVLNKDTDKMMQDFDIQFYGLLNDDDEKKGLHEYYYVLQQKIIKLTQENEELKKFKSNAIAKERNNFNYNVNIAYTQLLQLSENKNKRNYMEYTQDKKSGAISDNKKKQNNINEINKNENNQVEERKSKEHMENARQINSIKLKSNNNNNNSLNSSFKKMFNNPFNKKELTFKKK